MLQLLSLIVANVMFTSSVSRDQPGACHDLFRVNLIKQNTALVCGGLFDRKTDIATED
jgi:hypothetical protein